MVTTLIDPRGGKTRCNRPPVPWECSCGKNDPIVLPQATGVLVWHCDCGSEYRITFNRQAGDICKLV